MERFAAAMLTMLFLPFAIAAVLPSRRWLIAYGLFVFGFFCWVHYNAMTIDESNDSFGALLALGLFYTAAISGAIGTGAKAVSLALRAQELSLWIAALPLVFGFTLLLVPVVASVTR
ncbi:MAG: hypothetical protein AAF495_15390 [Pseudomonadota bacterium]